MCVSAGECGLSGRAVIDVAAAVFRRGETVLLARRARGEQHALKWEFPGGKIEPGESPEQCLQRELLEELAVGVEVGCCIAESLFHYEHASIRLLAHEVRWRSGEFVLRVHDRLEWVAPSELDRYDLAQADIPIARVVRERSAGSEEPNARFYRERSQAYFRQTASLDPTPILSRLSSRLRSGARVLDLGCGSGRDLRWLKKQGFQATGMERAAGLAELARHHSGCPVIRADFSCYDFSAECWDGLLFNASLVHLQPAALAPVLRRAGQGLQADGLLLLTLKEGQGRSRGDDGRRFTLWQEERLALLWPRLGLRVVESSRDPSPAGGGNIWLSYLLAKCGGQADV
ncbi:NUDIX domain-containing protein [Desulfogranum mediterraneum]|uniref:NUDIX domain-containing protein n=1 Tax=Desulfogranum mediterraneum TaxID=160661 RepID=UPI0003FFD7B0|nr:NUDIX domain-containing protein [Desulfogranum mediterraneum]